MEQEAVVSDTLRQNDFPESEMINRDKRGAVVELAMCGTPKKTIAGMLDLDPKSVRAILAKPEWTPYTRRPAGSKVLAHARGTPVGHGGDLAVRDRAWPGVVLG